MPKSNAKRKGGTGNTQHETARTLLHNLCAKVGHTLKYETSQNERRQFITVVVLPCLPNEEPVTLTSQPCRNAKEAESDVYVRMVYWHSRSQQAMDLMRVMGLEDQLLRHVKRHGKVCTLLCITVVAQFWPPSVWLSSQGCCSKRMDTWSLYFSIDWSISFSNQWCPTTLITISIANQSIKPSVIQVGRLNLTVFVYSAKIPDGFFVELSLPTPRGTLFASGLAEDQKTAENKCAVSMGLQLEQQRRSWLMPSSHFLSSWSPPGTSHSFSYYC